MEKVFPIIVFISLFSLKKSHLFCHKWNFNTFYHTKIFPQHFLYKTFFTSGREGSNLFFVLFRVFTSQLARPLFPSSVGPSPLFPAFLISYTFFFFTCFKSFFRYPKKPPCKSQLFKKQIRRS